MGQDPRHWIQIIWGLIIGRAVHSTILVLAAMLLFSRSPYEPWLAERVLPSSAGVAWLGFAMTAAGAIFTLTARAYLGRNWNARPSLKEDHEVVRSGPYALVRHPIYSGLLLTATGTAVAVGLVRSFLALPLILLGFWLKSYAEERLLTDALGEPYASYRRAVRLGNPPVHRVSSWIVRLTAHRRRAPRCYA